MRESIPKVLVISVGRFTSFSKALQSRFGVEHGVQCETLGEAQDEKRRRVPLPPHSPAGVGNDHRTRVGRWILFALGGVILVLVMVRVGVGIYLNTGAGKAFVARRLPTASACRFRLLRPHWFSLVHTGSEGVRSACDQPR